MRKKTTKPRKKNLSFTISYHFRTNPGAFKDLLPQLQRGQGGAVARTHQVVAEAAGPQPEVVPDDEQRQEEGQHVDLPVPDRQHERLQAEGPGGSHIGEGVEGGWRGDKTKRSSLSLTHLQWLLAAQQLKVESISH